MVPNTDLLPPSLSFPKMAATKHIWELPDQAMYKGGKIYDRFGNLAYFADVSALNDEAAGGGSDSAAIPFKAHKRLPYINSKVEISVSTGDRFIVKGVNQLKGALPGYNFTLYDGIEKRQFTTTASVSAVYTWLKKVAKVDITMLGPTGTPKDVIPATSEDNG